MQLRIRRAQPSECALTKEWFVENHYLDEGVAISAFVLEFLAGDGELVGAMILGSPHGAGLDGDRILELYRVYFIDGTDRFIESRSLGMMRKFVRTWCPQIKLMLSYSDPSVGHRGTIYEADGWAPFGHTKRESGAGWGRHKGRNRKPRSISSKVRWVRTP